MMRQQGREAKIEARKKKIGMGKEKEGWQKEWME